MASRLSCVIFSASVENIPHGYWAVNTFCVKFFNFLPMGMIYKRIRTVAKEKGLTITGLEKELGFAKGSLSKIDKNKPSEEKVAKLSARLGVDRNWLMGGSAEDCRYSDVFRENVSQIMQNTDPADIEAAASNGLDLEEINKVCDSAGPISLDEACKVADSLGESLEYLLDWQTKSTGFSEDSAKEIQPVDVAIVKAINALSPESKKAALAMVRGLRLQQENKDNQ